MGYTKVGIDIGSNEVKCVVIEEKGGIYSIKNRGTFEISSGLKSKEYAKKLKKGIKKFLRKSKISTASLNFSIPVNSTDVIVKVLHFPIVEDKWLDSTVQTELDGSSADDLSDYVKRWDILEKDEAINEYTVLTVLLKSAFTKLLNDMANITCKVETIEIQPITVGRLINNSSVFIDFGHAATRLYAFKNGKLVDVQVIKNGGDTVLEKIKAFKGFSTSNEHAKSLLNDVKIQVEDTGTSTIDVVVTEELNTLIEEIKRRIRGIEINHNLITESIYYAGELSNIEDFESYLSSRLEYYSAPIEFLTDLDDSNETNKYLYAASCILAKEYGYLKGMNFAEKKVIPIDVNFLVLSIVTLMIVSTIGFIDIHRRYDNRINEVQLILDDLRNQSMTYDNDISLKRMDISMSDEFKNKLYMLEDRKTWVSDMFYIIPETTPENVIITEIDETSGITTIKGTAESYTDIGVLSIGLENYGKVVIEDISIEEESTEIAEQSEEIIDTSKKIEQGKKKFKLIVYHNINLLNNHLE